jgi:hypothetical protein
MMKQASFLLVGILAVLFAPAGVQAIMPIMPDVAESHNYTYVVDKEGEANVWLRVDGMPASKDTQVYSLTLPETSKESVLVWYREDGCMEYKDDVCVYYGSGGWQKLETTLDGKLLSVTIPGTERENRFRENRITLGVMYQMGEVTDKTWWGRKVNVETVMSENLVSYLNIGVHMPEGVYLRDKTQGPDNWGSGMMTTMMSSKISSEMYDARSAQPGVMFDMAGNGQVNRYKYNLMPGQTYEFSFMSATSVWKLYYSEMLMTVGWLLAISMVLSALLRLILDKKPLTWYMAVIGLLVLLGMLIVGLWFTYRGGTGRAYMDRYSSPVMYKSSDLMVGESLDGTIEPDMEIEMMPVESLEVLE